MSTLDWVRRIHNVRIERSPMMSDEEYVDLQLRLEAAASQIRPFEGPYEADWLLSDWNSPVWRTRYGAVSARVDGEWVRTLNISWQALLPNGTYLTDPDYDFLLETLRRAAFLRRQGFIPARIPGQKTWRIFTNKLIAVSRWLLYQEKYGSDLRLLDQAGLNQLATELATGGWSMAMRVAERTVSSLYHETFGDDCPPEFITDPGNLPHHICLQIVDYLHSKSAFSTDSEYKGSLSRKFLSDLISEPVESLTSLSDRTRAVIRQFEPLLQSSDGLLIRAYDSGRKFPTHRTLTVQEALHRPTTQSTVRFAMDALTSLLSMYRHLSDRIPDPCTLQPMASYRMGRARCRPERSTQMIPMDIGLAYLGEAIRWIHCFGDEVVDYYLRIIRKLHEDRQSQIHTQMRMKPFYARVFAEEPFPEVFAEIGLTMQVARERANSQSTPPSFSTSSDPMLILKIWVGAVTVLIGMLKPSRVGEVQKLSRKCLIGEGPYWLDSRISKKGVSEHDASSRGQPIPTITAKAIQQLQRLGNELKELYGETDPVLLDKLFYLPNLASAHVGVWPRHGVFGSYLDAFCDYVDLTTDALGRRWYIRVHEMRKWFLLLMFWSGRFDVLDAVRDIAGHNEIEDLYAYVEREFPESSLAELEADYSIDRLRELDRNREISDQEVGLNQLYEKVLQQFSVKYLELVSERSWTNYVRALREKDVFHLEPYCLSDETGRKHLCIAFRSTDWNKT